MARQSSYQREFRKRQRQGKADLRFLVLLELIALLFYSALALYLVSRLTIENQTFYMYFGISLFVSLLAWCVVFRLLWHFNQLGKLLYWVFLAISAYCYRDVGGLLEMAWEPVFYQYCLIGLFIFKCVSLLYGGIRLALSANIRSIWSMNDLFDSELAAMEAQTERKEHIVRSKQDQATALILKKTAWLLGGFLYLSMIILYLVLGLMGNSLPQYEEALRTIQYQLFSECLFSALLWSIAIMMLHMGRAWSPYLLYVCGGGEFIRAGLSYVQYVQIYQNTFIQTEIKLLFTLLAFLRYLMLYFICRNALRHPIIRALRSHEAENNE